MSGLGRGGSGGGGRDKETGGLRGQRDDSPAVGSSGTGGVVPVAELLKLKKELDEKTRGCRSQKPMSPRRLPKGFEESSNPTIAIPTSAGMPSFEMAVVRHGTHLAFEKLPITLPRPRGSEKPALAAAAFDAPEFISGTLKVKPGAMKDEESTFNCTQVFVVLACQPRGLQVDINGQCYLMSPGDHFFVPQGTLYRIINHAKDTDAEVVFVVIKPGP